MNTYKVTFGDHKSTVVKAIKAASVKDAYRIVNSILDRRQSDSYIQYIEYHNKIVYDYLGNFVERVYE